MKEIKLSQTGKNKGKYVALVDDEDYEYLNQWKWCINSKYVTRGIRINKYKTINLIMHRVILNTPIGLQTDHIDHNTLNNQKSNIRICTNSQNQMNKDARGKSKYKGVCIKSKYKYINSVIGIKGKKVYLGLFKTEEDAARAYDKKALEVYGEFANLNFK